MKLFVAVIGLTAMVAGGLQAQTARYGHINFGNLLTYLPETLAADSLLQVYRGELTVAGEQMAAKLQTDYLAFIQEYREGKLTPLQQQEKQTALQQQQQSIQEYEQEMVEKLGARRQELLEPIVTKAEAAIAKVAKANGFVMVFDTSIFNTILFAADTEDMLNLVLKDLGVEATPPNE
jgi:outer membrane protein